jgi:hypothetical protein
MLNFISITAPCENVSLSCIGLDNKPFSIGAYIFNMKDVNLKHRSYKHGLSRTRQFKIWQHIRSRTMSPSNDRYHRYGGRGIKLCDEWMDFVNFYNWSLSNGYSDKLTIDRINNEDNYCPENCRWVTRQLNSKNMSIYPMTRIRKHGKGWQARGMSTSKCLGTFPTIEEARKARDEYDKIIIQLNNKQSQKETYSDFFTSLGSILNPELS